MAVAGPRVLVIEDDDGLRDALMRLLGAAGFRAAAYASAEALPTAWLDPDADGGVACVVSDLRLPGRSGLDLLSALRVRGAAPPLILITGHDAPGLRAEALRRGAAAYLVKPFPGTALLEIIRSAIASPAAEMKKTETEIQDARTAGPCALGLEPVPLLSMPLATTPKDP